MASRYVRSVFWLCTLSGLGYGLLVLTTPSEAETNKLRKKLPGVVSTSKESISKNQQFADVLQAASDTNKPFYRLSKSEIEQEIKK